MSSKDHDARREKRRIVEKAARQVRAARLKQWIADNFDSETAFADLIDMSANQLGMYTNGGTSPGLDILERMLNAGLNLNYYIGGRGPSSVKDLDVRSSQSTAEQQAAHDEEQRAIDEGIKLIESGKLIIEQGIDRMKKGK